MKSALGHQVTFNRKQLSPANTTCTVMSCSCRNILYDSSLSNILYESSGGGAGYFDTFGRLAAGAE